MAHHETTCCAICAVVLQPGQLDCCELCLAEKAILQKDVSSHVELVAKIEIAEPASFTLVWTEDWGASRSQGKRFGHMVRGAMADPPRGRRIYSDPLGLLAEDERLDVYAASQIPGSYGAALVPYLKARGAGLCHNDAVNWAYEAQGLLVTGETWKRMQEFDQADERFHP